MEKMTKKKCRACLEEKEFDDFYLAKWSKDGKNNVCKECTRNKVPVLKGALKTCPLCEKTKDTSSFYKNKGFCRKCTVLTSVQKNKIGERFTLTSGEKLTVIEYYDKSNITVQFDCGCILKSVAMESVVAGWLKNPMLPSICDVGFLGAGVYNSKNNKKVYNIWSGMIRRCYDEKTHDKLPTYKDVTICEEWHNFQVFAKWYDENYNLEIMTGWELDKDILQKGNKSYSPETCCLVPHEINNLFRSSHKNSGIPIGMVATKKGKYQVTICGNYLGLYTNIEEAFQTYKTAKEEYIKEVADKWKHLIDPKVYDAMHNYKIEIND